MVFGKSLQSRVIVYPYLIYLVSISITLAAVDLGPSLTHCSNLNVYKYNYHMESNRKRQKSSRKIRQDMYATADCFSESDYTEENQMESFPQDNDIIKKKHFCRTHLSSHVIIRISLNHRLHDTNIQ